MAWREISGFVAAVIVFFALVLIISNSAQYLGISAGNPVFRLVGLFVTFMISSSVFYWIRGPQEDKLPRVQNPAKSAKGKDISSKLKEMRENDDNEGKSDPDYLVCEDCGGYYKLQSGESADDFSECECGGKLK